MTDNMYIALTGCDVSRATADLLLIIDFWL